MGNVIGIAILTLALMHGFCALALARIAKALEKPNMADIMFKKGVHD